MQGKAGIVVGIMLTIVALVIGLYGIVVFIGTGEATNNGIVAFAAVSFPFALLAALFSWIVPRAKWAIAVALCGPVGILSFWGSWSGSYMLLGAIWTVAITCAGAFLGGRLRKPARRSQQEPPF